MKKKLLTILMTLCLVATFMPIYTGAAFAATEGTAIATADDLKAMESNPSGSYYLAKDIDVPANLCMFTENAPFTGTLDGNGHALNGITFTSGKGNTGLFKNATGATFKDLTLKDVNVNISTNYITFGTLVGYATDCTLSGITVTGNIIVDASGEESSFAVCGLAGYLGGKSKLADCHNKADIKGSTTGGQYSNGGTVCGLARGLYNIDISKCTNSGELTVNASGLGFGSSGVYAYGIASGYVVNATSCKNSGNVAVNVKNCNSSALADGITVTGMGNDVQKLTSCSNTGKITLNSCDIRGEIYVAGLATLAQYTVSKCYNKGAINVTTGKFSDSNCKEVGGLVCSGVSRPSNASFSQSYNKGNITVNTSADTGHNVGGLAGMLYQMSDCYNAGKITLNGNGNVGGLAGTGYTTGKSTITKSYSSGKVVGTKGASKGALLGYYSGSFARKIYNNYYTGSTKPYGRSDITWKAYVAKATKVSSFTASKCPKLSSKYWTYSSKYKRLILKNNKEA